MNARKTRSGIISVLIEPCRKKSRSPRDHVGTCAAVPFAAETPAGDCLSVEVVQEFNPATTASSVVNTIFAGFMPATIGREAQPVK